MVSTVLSVLFVATAVSGVQVDYAPPAASSYIYRTDHGGPASLVKLGAHSYDQPLVLAQPLKYDAIKAYDFGPAPLPYVAAKPIIVEDAEDDGHGSLEEYGKGDGIVGQGGYGFEKGAGNDYGEEHHSAKGEKGIKGYNSKGHYAAGKAGSYGKEHDAGFYSEAEGKKKGHYDEADAHGKNHESGESYKGGDHGHKQHFSKGEDVSGYHKIFHKDEYKKDHDFYDVADKSGHFKKHGYEKEHHGSEKGGYKKGGEHDSAFDKGGFGKSGFHSKGHVDDAHKGHSAEEGYDSHFKHHDDFGKKGGSGHEKEYAYGDDDDDDDDEDDKE